MINPIQLSGIRTDSLLAANSRYLKQNIIYYGEKRILTFDTYIKKEFTPTGYEKTMLITKGFEYRPDLVSYNYYGFVDYWWKILECNKMKDIFDFKAGKTIILPSVSL